MRFEVTLLLLATVAMALPTNPNANDSERTVVDGLTASNLSQYLSQNHQSLTLSTTTTDPLSSDSSYRKLIRPDLPLYLVPEGYSSEIHQMLEFLGDDMVELCHLYIRRFKEYMMLRPSETNLYFRAMDPDLFIMLPLPENIDENVLRRQLPSDNNPVPYNDVTKVDHGYFGAVNQGDVAGIIDWVERHLEIICWFDLLPFLQDSQSNPKYEYWAKVISRNKLYHGRYFFNDIMAFQVIPKIAILYVVKGEYDRAIEFIDAMMNNDYLHHFLKSTRDSTDINYYEQAAYAALSTGGDNAIDFLLQVSNKPGFYLYRLRYCASPKVRTMINNASGDEELVVDPDLIQIYRNMCEVFKKRLERVSKIDKRVAKEIANMEPPKTDHTDAERTLVS